MMNMINLKTSENNLYIKVRFKKKKKLFFKLKMTSLQKNSSENLDMFVVKFDHIIDFLNCLDQDFLTFYLMHSF